MLSVDYPKPVTKHVTVYRNIVWQLHFVVINSFVTFKLNLNYDVDSFLRNTPSCKWIIVVSPHHKNCNIYLPIQLDCVVS